MRPPNTWVYFVNGGKYSRTIRLCRRTEQQSFNKLLPHVYQDGTAMGQGQGNLVGKKKATQIERLPVPPRKRR